MSVFLVPFGNMLSLHIKCILGLLVPKEHDVHAFKERQVQIYFYPSFPIGNSHLINGLSMFMFKHNSTVLSWHLQISLLALLANMKMPLPFSPLAYLCTGELHSGVQVQGECVWELLCYILVHALSSDPVWPLLVYRYQPWWPDHEGQPGKEDQRSCTLPA